MSSPCSEMITTSTKLWTPASRRLRFILTPRLTQPVQLTQAATRSTQCQGPTLCCEQFPAHQLSQLCAPACDPVVLPDGGRVKMARASLLLLLLRRACRLQATLELDDAPLERRDLLLLRRLRLQHPAFRLTAGRAVMPQQLQLDRAATAAARTRRCWIA